MARPQTVYEFSPTEPPSSTVPVWVDITQYVRGHTISRGRDSELERFDAGTLTLTLDNRNRYFDPSFAAGPWFGNLQPLRRIRVRRLLAGVYTPVFDGYVEGWPQSFDGMDATVTVTAADGFMPLARFSFPQWPAYNAIIGLDDPIAYWRMGDAAPPVVHDERGSAVAEVPAGKSTSDFGFPGSIVGDLDGRMRFTRTASDWVSISELPDTWPRGTLEAWWEPLDTSDSNIVSLNNGATHDIALYQSGQKAVFTVDPAGAAAVTVTGTTTLTVGTAYHIVGVFETGGLIQVYVNGVIEGIDTLGGSAVTGIVAGDIAGPTVGGIGLSNGYMDEVAIYGARLSTGQILTRYNGATEGVAGLTPELSGSRVGRLLARVGNWAADSEVAAGTMDLEGIRFTGQTLRSEIEAAELSEDGAFFVDREGQETFYERDWQAGQSLVATFGTTVGALPLQRPVINYDQSFLINSWNLTRPGSETPASFQDSSSIGRYFERSQNVDTLLTSDGDVDALGARLLARYKEPELRVTSFQVKPLTSPALTAAVLAIELRDIVGVSIVPYAGGAAIEQESYVERIVDTENPSDWTVEYGISPR